MNIKDISKRVAGSVSKNLPTIATGTGIAGFITTVALAITIAPKAKEKYEKETAANPEMKPVDKAKILAKEYWPVALSGSISIGCFILSNRVNLRRNAAAIAAYQVSEAALNSFRDAAVKTVGEKKTRDIEYAVAEDKIRQNPVSKAKVLPTNNGDELCYDAISGRYFLSTREKIMRAVNEINKKLMVENTISLNEFYDLIDLPAIAIGDSLGWNANTMNDLLDVTLSSHITDDGRPALVIEYDVAPTYDYFGDF